MSIGTIDIDKLLLYTIIVKLNHELKERKLSYAVAFLNKSLKYSMLVYPLIPNRLVTKYVWFTIKGTL